MMIKGEKSQLFYRLGLEREIMTNAYQRKEMRGNPTSAGLDATYNEIVTVAGLLGDHTPIVCSCCMGTGTTARLWGVRSCGQCGGDGYDAIGMATRKAMLDMKQEKRNARK